MAENLTLDGNASGNNKKRWLIIGLIALLVIGAGASGYYWFAADKSESLPKKGFSPVLGTMAMYVNTSRPFVFNVSGGLRDRLVEIRVQLLVRSETDRALVQANLPLIESIILSSFSAATVEQWRDPRSRELLRDQALKEVRDSMEKLVNAPAVEQILLTSYVMQ
ncbi:flagellar basal body-associated protein FliL [Plesiomonas shigelloides]|uniref:flagellar basal body-associated FliL family protein n=1 Tax=Plesiomonas shigelloides TaxID=703 RepID=UPI000D9B371F|nr:flagellar basal body-associated FliL family protein [Plesiomonas shigelloides]SPZ44482.1 flagellar basal body-associated protein FliL [Plesiomonas shigelloides]